MFSAKHFSLKADSVSDNEFFKTLTLGQKSGLAFNFRCVRMSMQQTNCLTTKRSNFNLKCKPSKQTVDTVIATNKITKRPNM